ARLLAARACSRGSLRHSADGTRAGLTPAAISQNQVCGPSRTPVAVPGSRALTAPVRRCWCVVPARRRERAPAIRHGRDVADRAFQTDHRNGSWDACPRCYTHGGLVSPVCALLAVCYPAYL